MGAGRTVVKVMIGGTAEDCAAAFLDAVQQAERGGIVQPRRVLAFESWEAWHRCGLAEVAVLLAQVEAETEHDQIGDPAPG